MESSNFVRFHCTNIIKKKKADSGKWNKVMVPLVQPSTLP